MDTDGQLDILSSGLLTLGGTGGANNETMTFDFESVVNTVRVNTSAGSLIWDPETTFASASGTNWYDSNGQKSGTIVGEADDGFHISPNDNASRANNNVIIVPDNHKVKDFDHSILSANPTLFIHSDTNPDTNNTEWCSHAFIGTGSGGGYYNIATGVGDIALMPVGNVGIGTTEPTTALQMGDDKLIAVDTNAGITASDTQSQGDGALTAQVNEISIVASDGDNVTLIAAVAGVRQEIINHGTNTLQIFPASGDNLGKGVDVPEELELNEAVDYVAYDTTNWAKDATTEIIHAEMFDYDNADPYTVNAASEAHMYHTNGIQAGDLADWTFDAGGAGTSFAVASIADGTPSGQQAEITTTDNHGLAIGDIVSLTAMSAGTNTGTFIVRTPVGDKTFEITSSNSTTATGVMDQASVLIADTGSAGQYLMNWCASAAAAGANDVFDFAIHVGATHINSTNIRRKFGGAGDVGAMSGVSIITIADGDRVSFMITNTSDAGNITMRDFALVLVRL